MPQVACVFHVKHRMTFEFILTPLESGSALAY